jgi:hypothetical protein
MNDTFVIVRRGRSWFIRPTRDGWVFHKSFPTRWKAELALEVWHQGGRVSDYWAAARATRMERDQRRQQRRRRRPVNLPAPDVPAPAVVAPQPLGRSLGRHWTVEAGEVLLTIAAFIASAILILVIPFALIGGVLFVALLVPAAGVVLVALAGGLFGVALAGVGRQGWRTSYRGDAYFNHWGAPALSVVGTMFAFLLGAAVALATVFLHS